MTHILAFDEDVDVRADVTFFRQDAIANAGTSDPERLQGLGKGGWCPFELHFAAALGEESQRARNVECN